MNRTDRRRMPVAAGAVLLTSALVATAFAVDVKGSLRIPEDLAAPAPPADRRPSHYWEEWNGFLPPRTQRVDPRRELAVVLTGAGEPPAPINATVKLWGGSLLPSTIVLRAGQTIRIENTDDVSHELEAVGLEGFSAEATSSGRARTVNLRSTGSWPLRDRLIAHARGHLHVLADLLAVGTVDREGRFGFTGIAPGTYTLKVLHGARTVTTQEVTVPDTRELTLDPITLTAAPPGAAGR